MRALGLVAAVTATLLLASGCSSGEEDRRTSAPETCKVSIDRVEVERERLEWLDRRGPNIDRDLSATRLPGRGLCVEIVTDHADPGSTAVSYSIVARQGDQEWRTEGVDPSGQLPMRVDTSGCVRVTGELGVLGQDGETYPYRARMSVGCDGREAGGRH
ncbi:hypothetical protein [Nocardioides sp. SR21]|uniref:hypothetical protein n=1 Tax=Nocardioides sp. SR21 TaxID=2919501 RepID=UPI001FA94690|nr:hypothetical protein [Nocardioides sp. SR21]